MPRAAEDIVVESVFAISDGYFVVIQIVFSFFSFDNFFLVFVYKSVEMTYVSKVVKGNFLLSIKSMWAG